MKKRSKTGVRARDVLNFRSEDAEKFARFIYSRFILVR